MADAQAAPLRELAWARAGSRLLRERLDELGPVAAEGASLLPGWSRAHVLTHLARNADALANLLTWARTGAETPMYPDPATRREDIERGSRRPASEVLADVLESDARLLAAADALPDAAWRAAVRSALGRTVPAAEVAWLRTRELWIHRVDLGTGDDFDGFPPDLLDALLEDVSRGIGAKEDCPPLSLRPDDRDRTYRIGPGGSVAEEVTGSAGALCAWLAGRDTPAARTVTAAATVPPWL
ncbi:maleylpyruvate isomerase family mycothiol-dependent enzyme [Nocardiopsis sp. NPDC050513]|uniref:maleylpyruvate isomerase family mycothiol-dependent enzyme n=1 Tax=Nocardiopsis sp. NPDC050513 TaxID=3364338 RepID=UPI003796E1D7